MVGVCGAYATSCCRVVETASPGATQALLKLQALVGVGVQCGNVGRVIDVGRLILIEVVVTAGSFSPCRALGQPKIQTMYGEVCTTERYLWTLPLRDLN